jgi:hypothetical protein
MALPAKIQRDLDRANALLNPPQEPQVAQPVVQTPVAEATQVQPPAPTPVPAPTAPPVEDWEHKYRTLQGVHNAHTRDLKQRIGDLEAHIAQLAAQASAPATPQAPELNPQDAETFGQDLVEMVRRTAEAQSGAAARELQGRIAQLEQQLAGASAVASKTADEVFYERLAQLVPDWETVNQHEGFLAWLSEVDPLFGQPRQVALTQAGNARDVNRVAHVFKTYLGQAPETPKPATRQEPQVSPHTSGNGAAQLSPEAAAGQKPVITIQAVEAFYKDVQRGLWRGRDQEMLQQEAIINAALAENRIVDARQVSRAM